MQKGTADSFLALYDAAANGETGTQEFKFQGWGWVLSSGSPFLIFESFSDMQSLPEAPETRNIAKSFSAHYFWTDWVAGKGHADGVPTNRSERGSTVSLSCPQCEGEDIRRSQRKGIFESFVLKLVHVRPFRCKDCNHRFYRLITNAHAMERRNSASG